MYTGSSARNPEVVIRPEVQAEDLDQLFHIRPSVVDEWIEVINGRRLSTMELGSMSRPDIEPYKEQLAAALEVPDAGDNILAAGILYGICIGGSSNNNPGRPLDELTVQHTVGLFANAFGPVDRAKPSDDPGMTDEFQLFYKLREIEIDHFSSDILATTLPSVHDHIANIGLSTKTNNQTWFYAGALAGAMAVMPKNELADKPSIVMRDQLAVDAKSTGYVRWPGIEQVAGDTAEYVVKTALESEIVLWADLLSRHVEIRNGRLLQIGPNKLLTQGKEASAQVAPRNIGGLVVKEVMGDGNVVYRSVESTQDSLNLHHDSQIVGLRTKRPRSAFISFQTQHPHYPDIRSILARGNIRRQQPVSARDIEAWGQTLKVAD